MNTWFTDIVRNANERLFNETELNRIMVYYTSMPTRLRLCEELEKLEPTLVKPLHAALLKKYPGHTLYSRRFVQDLVESLRYLNRAAMADDMKLLRRRWTDHLIEATTATGIDPQEVLNAYVVMREMLEKQLPRSTWEALEPYYSDLTDALSRGPALV